MKMLTVGGLGLLLVVAGQAADSGLPWGLTTSVTPAVIAQGSMSIASHPSEIDPADLTAVVQRTCVLCHNDRMLTGNMSLEGYDVANPVARAEVTEKMIQKLRAGMMPPPGAPRPGGDTLTILVETLEDGMDRAAAANPNPGSRPFQRLNRVEYENSIRDLLGLEVNSGDYLPLDTKSANFDNIADAQLLSPTLMDAYMRAATSISRVAVGYAEASPGEIQYMIPRWDSQVERVEGAPFGTRGGTSVIHNFPADGEYFFRVAFHNETTGTIFGNGRQALNTADANEQLEISIDGERVALLEVDRWMNVEDGIGVDANGVQTDGVHMRTGRVFVRGGPRRVSAAFLAEYEGPVADLISPHDWSIISTATAGEYGSQQLPHLRDLVIGGPFNATGVSDTPVRQRIFSCRPTSATEARPCASQILTDLASKAYRRPVKTTEIDALLGFYEQAAEEGGFEAGIRVGLEAILASPQFVFRLEEVRPDAEPGESSRLTDYALASRLSFFLWGSPPDEELRSLAREGTLSTDRVLEEQARRLLADPRASALGSRFAAQWLRLQDLDQVHPDVRYYPDFHTQLRESMQTETELFFENLVREDRSVLEMLDADYTFVDERLAKHYGMTGVSGDEFRRVDYQDDKRYGILGHASVLTLTSLAPRTSPVLRGKWVMEVILGTPPPPPPPGVPALEETKGTDEGRVLTTRERMEKHRANPTCNACHRFMDPIGLSLDNFDATGRWRIRENGEAPLDTRGELYDGTPVASPLDLKNALVTREIPILRNFTKNMMAYALGRRVEFYDMPAVRSIVADAKANDYRMTSFILGVVKTDAFQMQRVSAVADAAQGSE